MQMRLTFIGADHEVTGSCHFLEVGNTKVLIDCGMEQGNNIYQNAELPVGYHEIDYVLLTHAHIDHAGMLPWIHARGFRGQVITTYATADLCSIMLKDSATYRRWKLSGKTGKRDVQAGARWKPSIPCRMLRMCLSILKVWLMGRYLSSMTI